MVMEAFPEAIEQLDLSSKLISYGIGSKYSDTIFTIMPYRGWVNLGFYRAIELPDPQDLLEGTGKLHRHIKVSSLSDLKNPALQKLVQIAVQRKLNHP